MKMFGSLPAMLLLVTTAAAQQVRFDDVVRNLRNPDPEARMSSKCSPVVGSSRM